MDRDNQDKIDFIGVGAARSGSTWLAQCLHEHPDILFPTKKSKEELLTYSDKELNFFSDLPFNKNITFSNYEKGKDWYLNQFPSPGKGKIRGEFSPGYLMDKKAYRRIYKHFPDVKIIIVLRNPVNLVCSLYNFQVSGVHERAPGSFKEAVKRGYYLEQGLYYRHLKKYFDVFPRKNIYLMLLDDFKSDSAKEIRKLYKFLGVRDDFLPPGLNKKVNTAFQPRFLFLKELTYYIIWTLKKLKLLRIYLGISRNEFLYGLYKKINYRPYRYPKMDREMKEYLKSYFQEDIEKIERLINRDLTFWKQ